MTARQSTVIVALFILAVILSLFIGLLLAIPVGAQEANTFYLPMVMKRTAQVKLSPAPGIYPLGYPDLYAVVRMPTGERCYQAAITWDQMNDTRFAEYHTDCVLTDSGWVALPWVSLYQAIEITGLSIRIVTDAGTGIISIPGVWEFGVTTPLPSESVE